MGLSNFYLTDAGLGLLARAQIGETLTITRAQVGEGTWPEGTTYANITQLVSPVKYMALVSKTQSDGLAKITVQFSNSGVNRDFLWSEFGLWAADPDYPDDRSHDILYGTAYADETPVPIESALTEFLFNVLVRTGNAESVTVVVDTSLVYMTRQDAEELIDKKIDEALGDTGNFVKKTGDTMTGSLTVDGGTAWKSVGAKRTMSDGTSVTAALGVGGDGGGAIEVTKYDAEGKNPTIMGRLGITENGIRIGTENKYSPENHLDALASSTTILAFANACTVSSSILVTAAASPNDAPAVVDGYIVVLVGAGTKKTVLFFPAVENGGLVFTRSIENGAWMGSKWEAITGDSGSTVCNITIPASAWVPGGTGLYHYQADVACALALATHFPVASLHDDALSTAAAAGVAPIMRTYAGSARFYAQAIPSDDMNATLALISGSEEHPGDGRGIVNMGNTMRVNVPGGVAGLDEDGKVLPSVLPDDMTGGFIQYTGQFPASPKPNTLYGEIIADYN